MARSKKNGQPANIFHAALDRLASEVPILAGRNTITPPPDSGDPGGPSRDRYRDRQKQKAKGKIGDVLKDNPIISKPGKIKIPVEPDKEPIWRPGRDQSGGGGGGGGEPGQDPGDFIEVSFDEFVEMFFESIGLPNMLKKMFAESMVKTHKRRGVSEVGPRARMNKHETAVARMKRSRAMLNSQPDRFIENFAEKCQQVFEAYVFWAASSVNQEALFPQPIYELVSQSVDEFLVGVENADESNPVFDAQDYRSEVLDLVTAYLEKNTERSVAPYNLDEALEKRIEMFVVDKERSGDTIPNVTEVPFHNSDLRFNRIEERVDPDSKAMVALVLDRSGSMDGDPIKVAKAYFFICVLFLKTKYRHVELVLISHDGQEYLWKTEEEFFKIGAGGGTVAVPAWDLVYRIAETGATCKTTNVSAGPFPASEWNRYMFHATDGQLFDGAKVIQEWWSKIIRAPFNYMGYLECETAWSRGTGWDTAGQALLGLPAEDKAFIGMAKARTLTDVPEAFKQILDKDRKKEV